jgi:3-phosphoshikimate 1-carboxyvinyltransferase
VERVFEPLKRSLRGTVTVPGDKSLSHRAVLFSAMAEGTSQVSGVLDSADVRATIAATAALGARVELCAQADGSLLGRIEGWGGGGPSAPSHAIDCQNSGTTARLLLGVLAGWPVTVTLIGDESLSRRPMRRVTDPLTLMGASFTTAAGGTLPVTVRGVDALRPISYDSPVASAQVKTAVLLAGLRAQGGVRVREPAPSRDHTERLLPAFGVRVKVDPEAHAASVCGPIVPAAADVSVPGDPSSAAFLVVAAQLISGSDVTVRGVSLNPTRTGFVRVLERMGADLDVHADTGAGNEPVGSLRSRGGAELAATVVSAEEVPSLVDEVPVLALAATQARGVTRFEGVGELRVKESDRLAAVARGLDALGCRVRSGEDWLEVEGPCELGGARLDSLGDHRLAMCWALAGLAAVSPVTVERFEAVDVSYPRFADDLVLLGA